MQLSETFAATHSNAKLMLLASGHELTDQLDAMWSAILEFLTISAENAELH